MKALSLIILCVAWLGAGCDSGPNTPAEAEFFKSAREGDVQKVSLLLKGGCSPEAEEKYSGRTALMYAAENGHLPVVQLLLSAKAKVNRAVRPKVYRSGLPLPGWESRTEHPYPGWTPLMFAAKNGHREIVRTLLAARANPNLQGVSKPSEGNNDCTALILAARSGDVACVEALLKAGAQVNASDLMGTTPLLAARNATITDLLIKAGANTGSQGLRGESLLRRAVGMVDQRMIRQALDAGADIHARDPNGQTIIFAARGQAIQWLVDAGADINVRDHQGQTPLMRVAANGPFRRNVMTYFKAGATLQGLSPWDGHLFLKDAVEDNDLHAVHAAIQAGADVNETRSYRGHVLLAAARHGNVEIVRLLLDAGADPNVCHDTNANPLAHAAIQGHTEIVRLLIARGANVNTRDKTGNTPLSWAVKMGRTATIDALRQAGARDPNG